jgi:hypothetical protein
MNIFTLIGVVVVVILVAGYFGVHGFGGHSFSFSY